MPRDVAIRSPVTTHAGLVNDPEPWMAGEEELAMTQTYRTLRVARSDEGVLSVVIDAPPMNLIGPELVRDLVALLGELESGQDIRVVVLESADREYFVPHVDLTKVADYTAEAARAGGPQDAPLGMLWHKLSELPAVTIAKPAARARPLAVTCGRPALSICADLLSGSRRSGLHFIWMSALISYFVRFARFA